MDYNGTMDLGREFDATYRSIAGRPIHAELLTHLVWRLLEEGYPPAELLAECERRAYEDAGLPPPPPGPAPVHPGPLRGSLRIAPAESCLEDDGGPVLPVLCHALDLLALYARDPGWAEGELDDIARAGYHGVRSAAVLAGEFWENVGRAIGPGGAAYWEAVRGLARALQARGLRWLITQGDLSAYEPVQDRRVGFADALARTLHDVELAGVVAGVDAGNEAWQTGEPDPGRLRPIADAFRRVIPVPIWSLTSPPGEDVAEVNAYAGSVYDVHGHRGGHAWDKIRHAFSIAYAARPARRLGVQSEPPGPGPLVSVTEYQEELDAEAMAMLAAVHLLSRQATVYHSSPGVSVRERGEFARQPGFEAVPALAAGLPRDLMRFDTLCHGGARWRGTRVLVVPEGSDLRCDHAIGADGRFVCAVYGPPGTREVPIERSFEGDIIEPGTVPPARSAIAAPSGERVTLTFTRGRIIEGRLS